jgi:hypothetical protein
MADDPEDQGVDERPLGARSGRARTAAKSGRPRDSQRSSWLPWVYGPLGVLLAAYGVSLVVRPPDQQWPWLDNWTSAIFEIVAAGFGLARAIQRRTDRAIALLLDLVLSTTSGPGPPRSPA